MILYFINSALPYGVKKQCTGWCRHWVMQEKPSFPPSLSLYYNYIVVGFLGIRGVQLRLRTNILHVMTQHTSLLHRSVWQLIWLMLELWATTSIPHSETDGTAMNMLYLTCSFRQWRKYWFCKSDAFCHVQWSA